ncbi:hypothetical protein [Nonomuraea sp. B5E05]|uniref:hypothetical protein n=1 Tax=Nonomuraea sp. B5E05 TaxID=3153569 RepID=UPI00326139B1
MSGLLNVERIMTIDSYTPDGTYMADDDFDFSVKLLLECANCAAGSTQSVFGMRCRVLPGDTFHVKIHDGQPPAQ